MAKTSAWEEDLKQEMITILKIHGAMISLDNLERSPQDCAQHNCTTM